MTKRTAIITIGPEGAPPYEVVFRKGRKRVHREVFANWGRTKSAACSWANDGLLPD